MSRHPRRETYGDGQYMYDDRYDAGEFETYGQSTSRGRGPSSGEFYHGQSPYTTSSSSSRRGPYDTNGNHREGSYAGEESLRRRLGRDSYGHIDRSTFNETDPRMRLGRDNRSEHEYGRRSGLSQLSAEGREARREAHREEPDRLEQRRQRRREARTSAPTADDYADGNPYVRSGRSERRGAVTSANDPYLANMQAARDEQRSAYGDRSSSVRGRGWFPAYEFR
ncbi:hypothetical protein EKO04_004077 [Ascochyta lentis]|uniref:Uncharacterized protein n=1 Tax=Ascochyta lentis TaxID=205686 RepID=A0A8H7MEK8_9PLEO|nr:hypothetical protein EKO04_004077 [Ascochyta lentis]